MEAWSERPNEIAYLLNPAFTGALLRLAVEGYQRETKTGMPFSLAFLILPFSLHRGTTERLPTKVTTFLQQWVQDNRDVLVAFPARMATLVPFTREGLLFASQRSVLQFTDDARIVAGTQNLRGRIKYFTSGLDVPGISKRALFTGRWLAVSGSPETLYAMLGVTP